MLPASRLFCRVVVACKTSFLHLRDDLHIKPSHQRRSIDWPQRVGVMEQSRQRREMNFPPRSEQLTTFITIGAINLGATTNLRARQHSSHVKLVFAHPSVIGAMTTLIWKWEQLFIYDSNENMTRHTLGQASHRRLGLFLSSGLEVAQLPVTVKFALLLKRSSLSSIGSVFSSWKSRRSQIMYLLWKQGKESRVEFLANW